MRLFLALTFFLIGAGVSQAEKLKVGVVNMRYLLNQFHETRAAEDEARKERGLIQGKDQKRLEAIKALQEELETMAAEVRDPSLSVERRKKVAKEAGERELALRNLAKEREEFLQRQNRAISEKMQAVTTDLRAKVVKAVQAHAEQEEVDFVIDASGITTAQVPFLLYVKEPVDITEGALEAINKDAPKPKTDKKKKK